MATEISRDSRWRTRFYEIQDGGRDLRDFKMADEILRDFKMADEILGDFKMGDDILRDSRWRTRFCEIQDGGRYFGAPLGS